MTIDIVKKIRADNEQSLFALMRADKGNPVKYMAKLNHVHGWSDGDKKVVEHKITVQGVEQIAAKYGIPQNVVDSKKQ